MSGTQHPQPWGSDVALRERPSLERYLAWRLWKRGDIVEDIVQEAICRFLGSGGLTPDGIPVAHPRAYLWGIARILLRQHWSGAEPDDHSGRWPDRHAADEPEPAVEPDEGLLDARAAVLQLVDDPRNDYLVLRGLGFSDEELVEMRGSTAGALRVHLNRRRTRVQEQLGPRLGDLLAA